MKFPKILATNNTIKLPNGKITKVVMLNNAATTPPFNDTLKKVNLF